MAYLRSAVLAAAVIGSATAAHAATYIYDVRVKTSFNTKFEDCFTFEGGKLTVAGLGTFVFTAAPTMPKHFYSAVATFDTINNTGANFAFAGDKSGTATSGKLHAVGSDSAHDSYVVEGTAVPACSGNAAQLNSWMQAR